MTSPRLSLVRETSHDAPSPPAVEDLQLLVVDAVLLPDVLYAVHRHHRPLAAILETLETAVSIVIASALSLTFLAHCILLWTVLGVRQVYLHERKIDAIFY